MRVGRNGPTMERKFAKRLESLPAFLFAEQKRKIEALRKTGVEVISLGAGDPDRPTPDVVVRAAQRALANPTHHRYPTNWGLDSFRGAVSAFMASRFGVVLDPEREILPALGGKEALHHVALACLEEGDICLAPDPGYPVYRSAPALAGAHAWPLPLRAERDFLPDLEAIPNHIRDRANLLYLNYPNNPTGAVASRAFFADVVAFAKEHDILVVHDNAYSEITFNGYRAPSFLETPGAKDVGVEIFSLSKGWNMTGWRAGWIAGNAQLIARYAHLKPNIDTGMFGAIQEAVIAALSCAREFPRQMSAMYRQRRDLMVRTLAEIGLQVVQPKATPFLWVKVPDGYTSATWTDHVLRQAGIVVSAGSAFGSHGEGYFRIALMVPDEELDKAAIRLADSIHLSKT